MPWYILVLLISMTAVYWFITASTLVEVFMIDVLLLFTSDEKRIRRLKQYFFSTTLMYVLFYISLYILK